MNQLEETDRVLVLKLSLYKRTLSVAFIALIIVWMQFINTASISEIEAYVLPAYSLFCGISLVLFYRYGVKYVELFENLGFGSLFIYYLSFFAYELNKALLQPEITTQKFLLWIPVIYILAFLKQPPKKAVVLSGLFFVSVLIVGIIYGVLKRDAPNFSEDIEFLLQFYASGLIYISLFYALSVFKDQFTNAANQATKMTSRANFDELTEAFSRAKINELLADIFKNKLNDLPLSVMLLDVDKLKYINDTYGHSVGDEVLKTIVSQIKLNLRAGDSIGRIGGDEFLIICPNISYPKALKLSDRLMQSVNEIKLDLPEKISVCIGVAELTQKDTPDSLIKRADLEMYAQKKSKRELMSQTPT